MSEEVFVTIVGAGVVGCAIAYELSQCVNQDIVVVEKNPQIKGENQSSRNSGVVHAGIFYPGYYGPLKSRLCVEGNNLIYKFCSENNVPCIKTGKLVVATNELEEEYLGDVFRTAIENSVMGIRVIERSEIKKIEPNVECLKALFVPTSGIIEPTEYLYKLYRIADSKGVIFLVENEVINIEPGDSGFSVTTRSRSGVEEFRTKTLINCAGLFADSIANMVDPESEYEIDPVKGESAVFYRTRREDIYLNGMNVYPVPFGYLPNGERLKVPFKEFSRLFKEHKVNKSVGVHITPTLDAPGEKHEIGDMVTIGPAYSKPASREDYAFCRDLEYFHSMVLPFFPNLKIEDISYHQVGIRAKLEKHYDFVIEKDKRYPGCINLIGIDSPGLTSSLAIARHVKKLLGKIK